MTAFYFLRPCTLSLILCTLSETVKAITWALHKRRRLSLGLRQPVGAHTSLYFEHIPMCGTAVGSCLPALELASAATRGAHPL